MSQVTQTPCDRCPGRCCAELAITASIVDVARIVRGLHIPLPELLAPYEDDAE